MAKGILCYLYYVCSLVFIYYIIYEKLYFFYPHMTYKFEGFKQMLQLSSAFAFILS